MKSIKICHICPSFENKLYQNFVNAQLVYGDNVRVFFYHRIDEHYPQLNQEYVDDVKAFKKNDRYVYFLKENKIFNKYRDLYDDCSFDINHAHTLFTSGYIAYKEKKRKGTPYIVAVRGTDVNLYFRRRVLLRDLGERILLDADAIIFLSTSHMNVVLDNYISKKNYEKIKNKVHIIPNGVDDFWLNNIYRKEKVSPSEIKLIYYGDINRNKNIDTLINIVIRLNEEHKRKASITLIGKIKEKKYTQMIDQCKYALYESYSPKEILIESLRKSDIFIMPSFSETFGLAYIEAMSQGLPVIYTEGQGFDGQFSEGHVGFHVNPNRIDDIINKIDKIYSKYLEISHNCNNEIQRYSWDRIAAEYRELYRSII